MNKQQQLKELVAQESIKYIDDNQIIGIGSGSTVNAFIDQLAKLPFKPKQAVAASIESEKRLKDIGIDVIDANQVSYLDIYIDGADEVSPKFNLIKGGGAALTKEKVLASISRKFICIIDSSKKVQILGKKFPLPIEVIPMARSAIARKIVQLGGLPNYRVGITTDYGNQIIDVEQLDIIEPQEMEKYLNDIPGVITNGIFALRTPDIIICSNDDGSIDIIENKYK